MSVKVQVIFYSVYGHVWKLAEAIAEGARQVPGYLRATGMPSRILMIVSLLLLVSLSSSSTEVGLDWGCAKQSMIAVNGKGRGRGSGKME